VRFSSKKKELKKLVCLMKPKKRNASAYLLGVRIELVVGDVGHDLVALLAPGVGLDQEQRNAQGEGREEGSAELHDSKLE
jgi:hypothetical protein